jgi:redox-regulated HSP33 family molecular chaperone
MNASMVALEEQGRVTAIVIRMAKEEARYSSEEVLRERILKVEADLKLLGEKEDTFEHDCEKERLLDKLKIFREVLEEKTRRHAV